MPCTNDRGCLPRRRISASKPRAFTRLTRASEDQEASAMHISSVITGLSSGESDGRTTTHGSERAVGRAPWVPGAKEPKKGKKR
jgi:hypothetical protein